MEVDIKLMLNVVGDVDDKQLYKLFKFSTQFLDKIVGESENWYIGGNNLRESLSHSVFDGDALSEKQLRTLKKTWFCNGWNGREQDNSASVLLGWQLSKSKQSFIVKLHAETSCIVKYSEVLEFINSALNKYRVISIQTSTDNYSLEQRYVFPDRVIAGWMVYIDDKIDRNIIPMAESVIDVSNSYNEGTLIISKKEHFSGADPDDIKRANEIEIQLATHGKLPLLRDILRKPWTNPVPENKS